MVSESEASYRLLEIVSLLLPVVAILLQVSLRLYTSEDTADQISDERKRESVQVAIIALFVLILSAVNTTSTIALDNPPAGNSTTLLLIALALFLLWYSVATVGAGAMEAFGGESQSESERAIETGSNGRINALRQKGADILEPNTSNEQSDTESEPDEEASEETEEDNEDR